MSSKKAEQLYCSVDLEFTGFDPERDQILEIGFAFFKASDNGLEVVEKWDQVFKPTIEVHPKILGLTGILQEELDAAPDFSEYREFLQDKLGDAVIVGHNPVMDVKFLESYGLKLSGRVIDTLELVQFILPTHHSYNLENLVHYFGIKHSGNKEAHRALGDALATIAVLENLMQIYNQFSERLKFEIGEVIARDEFEWSHLLLQKIIVKKIQNNDSLQHILQLDKLAPLEIKDNLINLDSLAENHEARVALNLSQKPDAGKTVLVVPDSNTVMSLWKENLVHGVFKPEDTFSKLAFQAFLKNAQTKEELRFCLKIIVWIHTNWQTEVVLDLNISFFGGQFRSFIVGGQPNLKTDKLLCADYATMETFSAAEFKSKHAVICDIQNFEKFMSSGAGSRLSWNTVSYNLKMIYNPETDFGILELKTEITEALASTDLFFSLVYMLLHGALPNKDYASLAELMVSHDHLVTRLSRAAENLADKLWAIEQKSKSGNLKRPIQLLRTAFKEEPNRVKWVTLDEYNVSLHDQPLEIKEEVGMLLSNFSKVQFTETISRSDLLSYFADRLGFNTEQSELPSNLMPSRINLIFKENKLNDSEQYELSTNSALPLVIVMPSLAEVKSLYNNHYSEIKQKAALFAQGYSGGGNKMFRNFSIKENSVLLVTAEFMAKQNYKIFAQTLVFTEQPGVNDSHPYTAALIEKWENSHSNIYNLLSFAKVCAALKKLKLSSAVNVIIFDYVDKER